MTLLAGPFIVAASLLGAGGAAKVVRPATTSGALEQMGLPSSPRLVRVGALAELSVAAGALAGAGRLFAALMALSYAAFAAFVVAALHRGVPLATCGCFGVADTPPTPLHVAVNLVAAGVAAAVAVGATGGGGLTEITAVGPSLVLRAAFAVLTAASAWLAFLALTELPKLTPPRP
jgi:hypothetical protein